MNTQSALPLTLRRMRLDAACIEGLVIPENAQECAVSWDIEVVALHDLALPRIDLADWLGCVQAHPHTDPAWGESIFLTLAVQANHLFEVMVAPGLVASMTVRPGDLFAFSPLKHHWLRPEGDDGFLSVQWTIPKSDFFKIYREIRKGLGAIGVRSTKVPAIQSAWKASIGEETQ
ncbi:hypothetical protein QO021_28900 (plasmid) [Pseudomonas amygdali pv. lachrymans]|uniref:hypothetical protein n=1 Tax=Pseudomonas amygdali TaxID=47877 RepID=UPI0006B9038B|nr:hypothetical protein [Pseudomonas amygdali]RMM39436.1 hypothetical protein ALQ79_200211 [Pseudomonas amygdali pv. lachrymans]WIO61578.1 hypothetical protein QO021_28900 [Pseudomonas amygdali pv. lachrymans]